MPMITRSVSPVNVSQHRLPPGVQSNELQWVANGTMANLMRQMSSLTQHACQIFGDVHKEIADHDRRIERIHDRISRLQENLSNPQEVFATPPSLDAKRKAFKSLNIIDQHTLDRQTLPPAIAELYKKCEDPPNLDLLNPYREDSKSALKYYTNPDYFFDLWKEEMLKEAPLENRKTARSARSPSGDRNGSPTRKRRQRTSTSATRQPQSGITPVQSNVVLSHYQTKMAQQNSEFMHFPSEYQAPQLLRNNNNIAHNDNMPPPPGMSMHSVSHTRVAPSRPQPSQSQHSTDVATNFQGLNLTQNSDLGLIDDDDDELPPPPPPLSDHTSLMPNLNSPSYSSASTLPQTPMKLIEAPAPLPPPDQDLPPPPSSVMVSTAVAPPPPPPPPPPPAISVMTTSTIQATTFATSNPVASSTESTIPKDVPPARVDLLSEIKAGFKLRKTQKENQKQEEKAALQSHNVEAILRQRMLLVNTLSDDEVDDDDDDEWD